MLSDGDVLREITSGGLRIEPFAHNSLQPCSYEVHLDDGLLEMTVSGILDPNRDPVCDTWVSLRKPPQGNYLISRGDFILGSTIEHIKIPPHLACRFEGKSSLGRLGLLTHITAGFVDPGFDGTLTVELASVAPKPIVLRPGMPIGQLSFYRLETACNRPYGSKELSSHYQGQSRAQPSRGFSS